MSLRGKIHCSQTTFVGLPRNGISAFSCPASFALSSYLTHIRAGKSIETHRTAAQSLALQKACSRHLQQERATKENKFDAKPFGLRPAVSQSPLLPARASLKCPNLAKPGEPSVTLTSLHRRSWTLHRLVKRAVTHRPPISGLEGRRCSPDITQCFQQSS